MYNLLVKQRSPNQTATAFSLDIELYEAVERARKALHMSRSNFIRMCLSKEIAAMQGLTAGTPVRFAAETRGTYSPNTKTSDTPPSSVKP